MAHQPHLQKPHLGVLGRPWTKRMVSIAISSTLKFQFAEHHVSSRFGHSVGQKIADPGPIKLHTILPLISVWGQNPLN